MPDFMQENICGQNLLKLVSRGNAIIAEILRLKDFVPDIYRYNSKYLKEYSNIILDFSYFKIEEKHNERIESSELLRNFDNQLKEDYLDIITRFYLTFQSVHTYLTDMNQIITDLETGYYIHKTLETVFADFEGRQLLCEALYLYGVMLLAIDEYIEGVVRERLIVSYYRYVPPQRGNTNHQIDDICKLLRDTGYISGNQQTKIKGNTKASLPPNYPVDYFGRLHVDPKYTELIISNLRLHDIYAQVPIYPLAKHRSVAFATQSAMLYVCLYFTPTILSTQISVMREICDNYFPDNWVISVYMGLTVNLTETWDHFKAAKLALSHTLEHATITNTLSNVNNVNRLITETEGLLKEGVVTKAYVLNDTNAIVNVLRECNVTLRWFLLHAAQIMCEKNRKSSKLQQFVLTESKCNAGELLTLMLNTAELEIRLKDIYKALLSDKDANWTRLQAQNVEKLRRLGECFAENNTNLHRWFSAIADQVGALTADAKASTAQNGVQLIQALEEVQHFHQLDSDMYVVQLLSETRRNLHEMLLQTNNVTEHVLITLQIITDFSYAWNLIETFVPLMHECIKTEDVFIIKFRAVFLKLASALEIPLLRLNQCRSDDLVSVSLYYSDEIEQFVRNVLEIVPQMMFEKLERLATLKNVRMADTLPVRLEKDRLKEYAAFEERYEICRLTHSIAIRGKGVSMIKTTLLGVVCLDPKKLLEDGVRTVLARRLAGVFRSSFGAAKLKPQDTENELKKLVEITRNYKLSFEYIQDYLNINGLKIWLEEITQIFGRFLEEECSRNWFGKQMNVLEKREESSNFLRRLANQLLALTDPRSCISIKELNKIEFQWIFF